MYNNIIEKDHPVYTTIFRLQYTETGKESLGYYLSKDAAEQQLKRHVNRS